MPSGRILENERGEQRDYDKAVGGNVERKDVATESVINSTHNHKRTASTA